MLGRPQTGFIRRSIAQGKAQQLKISFQPRCYASHVQTTTTSGRPFVKIVEVGPRDGLQNEPKLVDAATKIELISRLQATGLRVVESGSFVSPKWVPQMATTQEVLKGIRRLPSVYYPVLVPNLKGLRNFLDLLATLPSDATVANSAPSEIAIFTAASDSFSKANTNVSVEDSLVALREVARGAIEANIRVRGYVSTVITCPFEGRIRPERVAAVSKELLDMGCYEVSLGDTVGTGTKVTVTEMLGEVLKSIPAEKLAAHYHDTYGMAVANVLASLEYGIRTVDSSVAGLGGCPYSPGATGNVATEDIVHALHGAGYETGVDLKALVETGNWISEQLARRNESRAGCGLTALWKRQSKRAVQ